MTGKKWMHLFRGPALCLAACLHLSGGSLPLDTLWFNGSANGADDAADAAGISVIFDEFNVTSPGWLVQDVWSDDTIFSAGPSALTSVGWEIYSDINTTPDLVASGGGDPTYTLTGRTEFGSTEYMFEIAGLDVLLAPGTYWLAVYGNTPDVVPYIDTTSGTNGVGTPTGSNGDTYQGTSATGPFSGGGPAVGYSEGLAGISGVPEPSPAISLMVGLLMIAVSRLCRKRA